MPTSGTTDFQNPIRERGLTILRSFEDADHYSLLPQELAVAIRDDQRPDFLLELVRGQNPLLPPPNYGILDVRLGPKYLTGDALVVLRGRKPGAMLEEARFTAGFMRLSPAGEVGDAPQELFQPVPLLWNELGVGRFVLRLPLPAALLLKGALLAEFLPIRGIAEMAISGVAPRLSVRVRFDPARLLGALGTIGNQERQVGWLDIVEFFRGQPDTLPLEIVGNTSSFEPNAFAEAMADHVCLRFGRFIASPKDDLQACFALQSPSDAGAGSFEWDLSEPTTVTRGVVLTFNPLEVARRLVREFGPDSMIRATTVPPFKIGTLPVNVWANLPAQRLGVLSLGVTVKAPPRPPLRPQAIVETVELVPPADAANVMLRLSPAESPEYTFTTFAIVGEQMERYDGPETQHSGPRLDLKPHDFPLQFVLIEATSELLELADVQGVCRDPRSESPFEQPFDLNPDRRSVVIALPAGRQGATLEIEARAKDGQRTLRLSSLPAETLRLGLTSFREYGPHRIEIECVFRNNEKLIAIDLFPEGRPETPSEITTLHFTASQTKREWNWLARSPFYPGYKHRPHAAPDTIPAAWSQPHSPFERLVIDAGVAAELAT